MRLIDSDCSKHITRDAKKFTTFELKDKGNVLLAIMENST